MKYDKYGERRKYSQYIFPALDYAFVEYTPFSYVNS